MPIPGFQVDLDSAVPVYRQIAAAVRRAVESGRLRPGEKLPATRALASRLGVNRNTVVAAYESLASDGYVRSHTGRGTFLAAPPASPEAASATPRFEDFSLAAQAAGSAQLATVYRLVVDSDGISFAGSYPAGDMMPVGDLRECLDRVLEGRAARALGYGPSAGDRELRRRIAEDMAAKGSHVEPSGLVITNGAQQGLDLVFRALVDRGTPVVIEEPTYTGALGILGTLGARVVPVPVDANGVRTDALAVALERHRPRVVYLQPTYHNPTTSSLTMERRREVLRLAARHGCLILEDDWASDLRFEGEPLPSLHALDAGRRVIYLGTFSKRLIPGLRVGWLAAPPALRERVVALKQLQDFGTSPLIQAALGEFLASGFMQAHLDRVMPVYKARRDRMLAGLERHFPKGAVWNRPAGGLFVWVRLPRTVSGAELFAAARERGVTFSRGELFHSNKKGVHHIRLAFGAATEDRIESGISILGHLAKQLGRRGAASRDIGRADTVPIL